MHKLYANNGFEQLLVSIGAPGRTAFNFVSMLFLMRYLGQSLVKRLMNWKYFSRL